MALFGLFAAQAFYPAVRGWVGWDPMLVRYAFACLYIALAILLFLSQPSKRANLARLGRAFLKKNQPA
jgi:hypothetical protein